MLNYTDLPSPFNPSRRGWWHPAHMDCPYCNPRCPCCGRHLNGPWWESPITCQDQSDGKTTNGVDNNPITAMLGLSGSSQPNQ